MSHEPMTAGAVQKKSKIYGLSMTAVMAAVTCVLAPMSIPIGPVPISFTNLAIYLSLYLLGWKRGTVSYLVYVLSAWWACRCSPASPAAWAGCWAPPGAISWASSPWH